MGEISVRPSKRSWLWKAPLFASIGLMLLGALLNTPEGLLGKADAIGYAVCHRIDLRSFHIGERPLPLCARCTGMYLGAMLGLGYQQLVHRRRSGTPSKSVLAVAALLVLAFAVDGLNSYLTFFPRLPHLYQPNNTLRLITGTGMGLVISVALYPAFNQTVWQDYEDKPTLDGWRQILGLLGLAAVMDGLILTQNPLILYPFALLSALGVLVLLTMIYSMLWLIILRRENRYLYPQQLVVPLLAGFGFALLQLILIDAGRYLLTGTWDGFHIGQLENLRQVFRI